MVVVGDMAVLLHATARFTLVIEEKWPKRFLFYLKINIYINIYIIWKYIIYLILKIIIFKWIWMRFILNLHSKCHSAFRTNHHSNRFANISFDCNFGDFSTNLLLSFVVLVKFKISINNTCYWKNYIRNSVLKSDSFLTSLTQCYTKNVSSGVI